MANTHVPLAHADKDGRFQLLVDHLRGVEILARSFSEPLGAAECGALAGRWHDVGKFSGDFQTMIHGAYGMEAHIEAEGGPRDHSTAGALLARQQFYGDSEELGWALAWCIAGHHAGLSDQAVLDDRLRRKKELLARVLQFDKFTTDLMTNPEVMEINQDVLGRGATRIYQRERLELWSRPLSDGTIAIALFNRGLQAAKMSATWQELGLRGAQPVRDVWLHRDLGTFNNEFSATVPAHGTVMVKVGRPKT